MAHLKRFSNIRLQRRGSTKILKLCDVLAQVLTQDLLNINQWRYSLSKSRGSAVDTVPGYRLSPGRVKSFHFSVSSRLALGSTQPPIQWAKRVISRGKAARP
jgi:hypothetical protein